jgi:hypothetical protein
MPYDLNNEVDKFLGDRSMREVYKAMANPLIMTLITTLVIIMIVYLCGPERMLAISFYVFIAMSVIFMFHNTIIIHAVNAEKIDPSVIRSFEAVNGRAEIKGTLHHPQQNILDQRYQSAPTTLYGSNQPTYDNMQGYGLGLIDNSPPMQPQLQPQPRQPFQTTQPPMNLFNSTNNIGLGSQPEYI